MEGLTRRLAALRQVGACTGRVHIWAGVGGSAQGQKGSHCHQSLVVLPSPLSHPGPALQEREQSMAAGEAQTKLRMLRTALSTKTDQLQLLLAGPRARALQELLGTQVRWKGLFGGGVPGAGEREGVWVSWAATTLPKTQL